GDVRNLQNGIKSGQVRQNNQELQSLRDNVFVSTHAAAQYVREIAQLNHLDTTNAEHWGRVYAAYNLGNETLNQLSRLLNTPDAGHALTGRAAEAARHNWSFFEKGETGGQVLNNYARVIKSRLHQFQQTSLAQTHTAEEAWPAPQTPAS